uniref:hypothetical protein n=1 Tax=Streptomyces sp. NRRL F-5635 TaxID=1463865 RepID=UPI00055F1D92
GVVSFVEVGPGSVLSGMVADSVGEGSPAVGVPLLRKGRDEVLSLVEGVGRLHERGVTVDWDAFFAGQGAERIDLRLRPRPRWRPRDWCPPATLCSERPWSPRRRAESP